MDANDRPTDHPAAAQAAAGQPPAAHLARHAPQVRIVLFDVDGVMTDGSLYYTDEGERLKRFHVHDGHGIKMLRNAGIKVVAISGRRSAMTERRLTELGFDAIEQGDDGKLAIAERLLARFGARWQEAAAMGDDLPDLPLLERAVIAVAPANAVAEVRARVHWVTGVRGGDGAVRAFADGLLAHRSAASGDAPP
jgi:3-deoxy-D-manno-octulosonate 8-phosphate phosphatase (KDO 8-P phosphatase)